MKKRAKTVHPRFVKEYKRVINEDVLGIFEEREAQSYNANVALPDYFIRGEQSYMQMVWLKTLRAMNQVEAGKDPSDSLLDMINYAAFFLAYINLKNVESKTDTAQPPVEQEADGDDDIRFENWVSRGDNAHLTGPDSSVVAKGRRSWLRGRSTDINDGSDE